MAGLGAPKADVVLLVHDRWDDVVGSEVAAHVHPVNIEDGCLRVVADGPACVDCCGGVAMLDGPPASTGTAVSPLAAIEAAEPALRGCAAMAGEALMLEVSIEAGRATVAKGDALGHDADAVGACVRTVVAGLRFAAPTKAETIMKEVQP